jgi:hypothetical protein
VHEDAEKESCTYPTTSSPYPLYFLKGGFALAIGTMIPTDNFWWLSFTTYHLPATSVF